MAKKAKRSVAKRVAKAAKAVAKKAKKAVKKMYEVLMGIRE